MAKQFVGRDFKGMTQLAKHVVLFANVDVYLTVPGPRPPQVGLVGLAGESFNARSAPNYMKHAANSGMALMHVMLTRLPLVSVHFTVSRLRVRVPGSRGQGVLRECASVSCDMPRRKISRRPNAKGSVSHHAC